MLRPYTGIAAGNAKYTDCGANRNRTTLLTVNTTRVLEFAECYGHWTRSGADGWWQTADDAHDQREDDAA